MWPNLQYPADLITFTKEILKGKLHFLYRASYPRLGISFYFCIKEKGKKYLYQPIKCHCCPHIETSQFICSANQLTGFYMRATLVLNGSNSVPHKTNSPLNESDNIIFVWNRENVFNFTLCNTCPQSQFWENSS